jgi:hypothetical protein
MKTKSTSIPLPLPKTSKEKWGMYLNIENDIEMVLYDGKYVYTPDFPEIPIEQISISEEKVITQETLQAVCSEIMKKTPVKYNKEYEIWEAISDFDITITY